MQNNSNSNVSYDDLVAAELLPSDFELPLFVSRLPEPHRTQLLCAVLVPVARAQASAYEAQRTLFQSMSMQSSSIHLRSYCAQIRHLSQSAWHLLVDMGKPDYVELPQAVAQGTISEKDRIEIAALYAHWVDLQRCAGFATLQQRITGLLNSPADSD